MNPLTLLAGWKGYALTGVACLLLGFAGGYKLRSLQADHDALGAARAQTKAAVQVIARTAKAAAVTESVGVKTAAAQETVRVVTRTIIERVPFYVTTETDRRFPIPVGLVRLHDAAALGMPPPALPDGPGGAADSASAVTASALATTLAGNYGEARACAAQLNGWIDWYGTQKAAWEEK